MKRKEKKHKKTRRYGESMLNSVDNNADKGGKRKWAGTREKPYSASQWEQKVTEVTGIKHTARTHRNL